MVAKIKNEWLENSEFKSSPISTQSVEDRSVTGIAAVMGNIDDGSDITHLGAFKKTLVESRQRVRHLWNHDFNDPPIASIEDLKEIGIDDLPHDIKSKFPGVTGGLLVKRNYLDTPRGNEVLAGLRSGAINEMSFGFNPVIYDYSKTKSQMVRNLREVRLLDTSDVPWGMNPATVGRKGVLPYQETKTAEISAVYDEKTALEADTDTLKIICAWYDVDNSDQKSSYKLPHHLADDENQVVFAGVKNAMALILGAKGGIDIPDSDKRSVYNHLAKHYEQFDQEVPDYKLSEIFHTYNVARTFILNGIDLKVGRMFNAQNLDKLKELIDTLENSLEMLEDMLGIAESPSDESAESNPYIATTDTAKSLTNNKQLFSRIEIAKRKFYL